MRIVLAVIAALATALLNDAAIAQPVVAPLAVAVTEAPYDKST